MLKGARVVSCVIVLISTALAFSGISTAVDELAPDFSIEDIDGNVFTLSEHKGKVVLIDFTNTECTWCVELMRELVVIRENYTEQELVMISISVADRDTVQDIRDYRQTYEGTWAFAKDNQDLQSVYDISATPTEYFVDVNGCVQSKITGYRTWDVLAAEIEDAKTGCGAPLLPVVVEEEPAYGFTIADVEGDEFRLSWYEGRVVLIDFFIPSGLNSVLMHEELKAIRGNYTDRDLVMISIAVEAENDQEVKDFKEEHGGAWTYARDVEGLWQQYGVSATPTTCIVDVDGNVQFHNVGLIESQEMVDDIENAKEGVNPQVDCLTDSSCGISPIVPIIIAVVIIAVVLATVAYRSVMKRKEE
ncbi:MAG: TlpA family protein disulfide reductase [Thermoplasmata archaeon]|nr:TlpA family protein disulfide reductase [Thermoplasmata archaeon]